MVVLEELLKEAKKKKASDIHVAVGAIPYLRMNGRLQPTSFPPVEQADSLEILVQIMTSDQREKFEERGEFDVAYGDEDKGRYRIHAFKQRKTAAMVFHRIEEEIPDLDFLGMPAFVKGTCHANKGLCMISGPVGGGKSMTLAAMVNHINKNREAFIVTIENPVEYCHKNDKSLIVQREVGSDTKGYGQGLKDALREDADVIVVGEVVDVETLEGILMAVETGHLVLAAAPGNNICDSIEYLVRLLKPQKLEENKRRLAAALRGVVSQRIASITDYKRQLVFEAIEMDERAKEQIKKGSYEDLKPNITMKDTIDVLIKNKKITKEEGRKLLEN